jgi:hypothetical protein
MGNIEGTTDVIPFLDLKAQTRQIKPDIDAAVTRVIDSAQFVLGPEVAAFEERFAAYCDTKYCIALNSGTSALHLALLAAGIGPGDEVITVSMNLRRDDRSNTLLRSKAGLCRYRPRNLDDGSKFGRNGCHAAYKSDLTGSSARADGRHGSDH